MCDGDATDLHQRKLLLACVVVSGGSLILLGVVRALLVGVLVGWMNQFPGVLWGKQDSFGNVSTQKIHNHESIRRIVLPIKATNSTVFNLRIDDFCSSEVKEFTQETKSHHYSFIYISVQLPHHFHDMSAPLGEQLHALQGQVKQLPVLCVSLLGLLTP